MRSFSEFLLISESWSSFDSEENPFLETHKKTTKAAKMSSGQAASPGPTAGLRPDPWTRPEAS